MSQTKSAPEDDQPPHAPHSPHEVRQYLANLGYDVVLRGTGDMPLVRAVENPNGRRSPHITYYENFPAEASPRNHRKGLGWLRGLIHKGG